jgi:hypothetical protein
MSKKITENTIKRLVEEIMNEDVEDGSFALNSTLRAIFRSDSTNLSSLQQDFAKFRSNNPELVAELNKPSVLKSIYEETKDVALEGRSLDSFGGLLRSRQVSADEAKSILDNYFRKIKIIDEYIRAAGGAKSFAKVFIILSLRGLYDGIDKAFGTTFKTAYGNDNRNVDRLFIDIENLLMMSSEDSDSALSDDDLVLAMLGSTDSIENLTKFINRYSGQSIMSSEVETAMTKVQAFRKEYLDKKEKGGLSPDEAGGLTAGTFIGDSASATWTDVVSASSVLSDALDSIVGNLVKDVGGITDNEIADLKTISENVNEFEIEDMEQFFVDPQKKSDDERKLKAKIKKVLKLSNNWIDRNVPDDLALFASILKKKVENSIGDIKGFKQASDDWENPRFDRDRSSDEETAAFSNNLADLFSTKKGNLEGNRLANSFSKLASLEGSSMDVRIKNIETALSNIASGNANFELGKGDLGSKIAEMSVIKTLVDAHHSGIGQEIGYQFENLLAALMGGQRPGGTGTEDITWKYIDENQQEVGGEASAKSIVKQGNMFTIKQARSNINATLENGGEMLYYFAEKQDQGLDKAVTVKIFKVLVQGNTTADTSNQSNNVNVDAHSRSAKDSGALAANEFRVKAKGADYHISVSNQGNPLAKWVVPTRKDFATQSKSYMEDIRTDLKDMMINLKSLSANVERFLLDDDIAAAGKAADSYIELQDDINKTFFMKDQDIQQADPTLEPEKTNADDTKSTRLGRVGVKGDLEKVTNESKITARFLEKIISESFKK